MYIDVCVYCKCDSDGVSHKPHHMQGCATQFPTACLRAKYLETSQVTKVEPL